MKITVLSVKPDAAVRKRSFIRYETRFAGPAQLLEITDAYEGVEVFVNGQSTGIQVVPPFRYDLRGLTQEGENSLVIEVATTGRQKTHLPPASPAKSHCMVKRRAFR